MSIKGTTREESLEREVYFSDHYFSLQQLCSFAQQIHQIYKLRPQSMLEIGIGNGFTSTYFRMAGIAVSTVDINPRLKPDIVAPIDKLPNIPALADKKFDLVVCCEVLEHMPFDKFEESIAICRGCASRLFLTLPAYKRWYGISGFARLRGREIRRFKIGWRAHDKFKDLEASQHFWEIGSHDYSSRPELQKIIRKYYPKVRAGTFALNPVHEFFICE